MDSILQLSTLPLFIGAALALLLTPGPAVLYVVTRSIDQGRKAGLVSVLGIETATFVHVLAAALGVSAIFMTSALAFDVVKYAGAAYLIFLGARKLLTHETVDTTAVVQRKTLRQIYSQGMVVNILNPNTALFFFAFLPQFVDSSRGSVSLQIVLLGLIFTGMATCTDSCYAMLAGTAGQWLRGNTHFLSVQRYVVGTIYIILGIAAVLVSGHKTATGGASK